MSKKSGFRVKLIDVDNRLDIKYSKNDEVYSWGADNAYPTLIKSLIGSSVTARQCSDINAKNIFGKGFEFAGRTSIVNKDGLTLNQLLRVASKEFADQNNLFFHINYNALYEITSVKLIPCTDVRGGKSDSTGYSGKFVVYPNWDKSKGKVSKADYVVVDKFNPNQDVIESQVKAAGGWSKYKGQILHVKSDFSSIYSLSDADSVLYDMDSEFQSSLFKNKGLRKGFFGSKLIVTKPFDDDEERRAFERSIHDLKGAENSSGILLLEGNNASDVLQEQFYIQNIDTNIDDSLFAHTEESSAKSIRKAFGVPSILIEDSDNSIFGDSGSLLKEAKKTHWENKEEERGIIIEAFQTIFSRWHEKINPENNWNIIPIISLENTA